MKTYTKKLLSMLLSMIMLFSLLSQTMTVAYAAEVREIGTASELKQFASDVNSGQTGLNARLTADIVLNNEEEWIPIGTSSSAYSEAITITHTTEPSTTWDGTVAGEFSGGTGTAADPYRISSGDELAYLSALISDSATNAEYKSLYYVLTDDIDMGGEHSFTPIGKSSLTGAQFNGSFGGNGYKISNLKVKFSDRGYLGLFGYAKSAKLSNIVLIDSVITYNGTSSTVGTYVGGLIGSAAADTVIANCAVINGKITSNSYNVGGLAGQAVSTTIKETYVTADVDVTGSTNTYSYAAVMLGQSDGVTIEHCFARGSVKTAGRYTGGLIGNVVMYGTTTVKYSYIDTIVDGKNDFGPVYGAIGSSGKLNATNCYYNTKSACEGTGSAAAAGSFTGTDDLKSDAVLAALNAGGEKYARLADEARHANDGYPYPVNTYVIEVLPERLAAPANPLWINTTTASWEASENAVGYRVQLFKGTELVSEAEITATELELADHIKLNGSGSYSFAVKALGDGYDYYAGEYSARSGAYAAVVEAQNVTFSVSTGGEDYMRGGDPLITVAIGSVTVEMTEGVAKSLPVGTDYGYTVSALGFKSVSGTFDVANEPVTVNVAIETDTGWDGVNTFVPQLVDEVYQITSGYELAWFRDEVNKTVAANGNSVLNAKLARDIDLSGFEWVPISTYRYESYSLQPYGFVGTFDGNGKKVSGLYISTGKDGVGLFGTLMYTVIDGVTKQGMIKDLSVQGSISCGQYAGGIVGRCDGGIITGCNSYVDIMITKAGSNNIMVGGITGGLTNRNYNNTEIQGKIEYSINHGNITGGATNSYIGGVVGTAGYGVGVSHCGNEGSITGKGRIGGIAGDGQLPINECYNSGDITAAGSEVGGIVGFSNKLVKHSYNTGAVSGSNQVGGITGNLHSEYGGKVEGSYSSGSISASTGTCGSIAGHKGGLTVAVTKCYYLEGSAAAGIGSNANEGETARPKSEAELKDMETTVRLGGTFVPVETNYPILRWQTGDEEVIATVLFDVDQAGAAIKVTDSGNTEVQPTEGRTNLYRLAPGSYKYEIKKNGYHNSLGDFAVVENNLLFDIAMIDSGEAPTDNAMDVIVGLQQDASGFLIARQTNAVPPGLAAYYGYTNDANYIGANEISALDALVAAHIPTFGADKASINDALKVSSSGFITKIFGFETSAVFTYVNGKAPNDGVLVNYPGYGEQFGGYSINQMKLSEGDIVEFFMLQDTSAYSDYYAWFEHDGQKVESLTVTVGEEFSIGLKGYMNWYALNEESYRDSMTEALDALIVPVELDESSGIGFFDESIAAAEDGIAKITFAETGTYILSAVAEDADYDFPLMSPWLVVTVEEPAPEPVNVSFRFQNDRTGFDLAKELSVMPGLANEYGYQNSAMIGANEISLLDVLVAAHITAGYTTKAEVNAAFSAPGGFISKAFGIITYNFSFYVNGEQPSDGVFNPVYGSYTGYGASEAKVPEGGVAELFIVKAAQWNDTYSWFEYAGERTEAINVEAGQNFELTVKGYPNTYGLYTPAARAAVTTGQSVSIVRAVEAENGKYSFGETLAASGADGKATFSISEPGVYYLSAKSSASTPFMSSWLTVTVTGSSEEPDEAVEHVKNLIDALPETITLSDKDAVTEAKAAYDALSDAQKAQIDAVRLAKLNAAVRAISDLEAAKAVEDLIDALPNPENITLDDREAVSDARLAYDQLAEDQKKLVDSDLYAKLLAAEAKLAELEAGELRLPTEEEIKEILDNVSAYQITTINNPGYGATGGEWTVFGLARYGSITAAFKEKYLENLKTEIERVSGNLAGNDELYSNYSRVVLALTAIGENPADFEGYDLIKPLAELEKVTANGFVGTAYALLALDTKDYDLSGYTPEDGTLTTREALISYLLDGRNPDGGWAYGGMTISIADATAMVVQALAPYYDTDYAVAEAIDGALACLSNMFLTYGSFGASEPAAQVLIAMDAMDIPLDDSAFVNGDNKTVYDDLIKFYIAETGAFKHTQTGFANAMSTDQGMYALVSIYRSMASKTKLYDMSDVTGNEPLPGDVNKTALLNLIGRAQAIPSSDYTMTSYNLMLLALEHAVEVAEDTDATQEQVKEAYTALNNAINSLVRTGGGVTIGKTVTFRLIGAKSHPNQNGYGAETEYQNWIRTTSYTFYSNSVSVYEVFASILGQNGLGYVEKDGYVSAIQAPVGYGGQYLREMDNGRNSGWMYTVNGNYPDDSIRDCFVYDGETIIFHYVDDYKLETDYNGQPAQYPRGWLNVPDNNPPSSPPNGGDTGGTTPTPTPTQAGSVTVDEGETPKGGVWVNPFIDVSEGDWFYEFVKFANENSLMIGTGSDTFSPQMTVTRAMIVTVLYNYAGKPEVIGLSPFKDVESGAWYEKAIIWAYQNGIVVGYSDERFGPNDTLTREQAAVILYNYAKKTGLDTSHSANLSVYTDATEISDWAVSAMNWANTHKIINGSSLTELTPRGNATRAELAAILYNYIEGFAKYNEDTSN